jgi:hypothetical protein
MHNVLLILLHRPFVSDGDLHSSPSNAINSFLVCATAAKMIVKLLRAYDTAFSIQRAPYLISYATYVSATIHVRIAAQREPGSEAHVCLATCLDIFKKNQETNWAVRRANVIIQNLMNRMHVSITDEHVLDSQESQVQPNIGSGENNPIQPNASNLQANENDGTNQPPHIARQNIESFRGAGDTSTMNQVTSDLDIDAIIQSFIREQQSRPQVQIAGNDASTVYQTANQWFPSASFVPDNLPIQEHHSTQNLVQGDPFGVNYSQDEGVTGQFSADDMLFGFNSSAIEGIGWEIDDRML